MASRQLDSSKVHDAPLTGGCRVGASDRPDTCRPSAGPQPQLSCRSNGHDDRLHDSLSRHWLRKLDGPASRSCSGALGSPKSLSSRRSFRVCEHLPKTSQKKLTLNQQVFDSLSLSAFEFHLFSEPKWFEDTGKEVSMLLQFGYDLRRGLSDLVAVDPLGYAHSPIGQGTFAMAVSAFSHVSAVVCQSGSQSEQPSRCKLSTRFVGRGNILAKHLCWYRRLLLPSLGLSLTDPNIR